MRRRHSVLIIDDELHVIKTIKALGRWNDFNMDIVGETSDGAAAYQMICELCPDIIITDINMPYFNGLELVDRVRKQDILCKVIIVSGYDEFAYAKESIRLKVDGYILKPIKPDELNYYLGTLQKDLILSRRTSEQQKHLNHNDALFKKLDINAIEVYIKKHYTENITLEDTARKFFVSKEYLSKRFKEVIGISFSKYILMLKMEEARDLLNYGISPKKVSEMVGYYDHVHFHKMFKKYFGVTPKNIH